MAATRHLARTALWIQLQSVHQLEFGMDLLPDVLLDLGELP